MAVVHIVHHYGPAAAMSLIICNSAGEVPARVDAPEPKDAGKRPQQPGQAVKRSTWPEGAFKGTPEPEEATEITPESQQGAKQTPQPEEAGKGSVEPKQASTAPEPEQTSTGTEKGIAAVQQAPKEDTPATADPTEETKESWHPV